MCKSNGQIYEVGKTYAIQKTITTDTVTGNMVLGDGVTAHVISANSTTEYIIATGTGGDIRFNNFSVGEFATFEIELQEITNPNSFLTYYDTATKSHVTLGNSVDGGSSEELINDDEWIFLDSSIANNILTVDGSIDDDAIAYQLAGLEGGKTYQMYIEVLSIAGGTVAYVMNQDGTSYFDIDAVGVGNYSFTFTHNSTSENIYFRARVGTVLQVTVDTISLKEILPISTTYTQTNSHSNLFTTTVVPHVNDLTYLDAQPESVARLVDGETVSGLTFDLADIEAFYPANEGDNGAGANVYDVTDQAFLTFATITNYASTCRTNLDLTNYGASNLLYKQDASGRWLSMADANLIEFTGDTYATVDYKPLLTNFSLSVVFKTDGVGLCGLIGQTLLEFLILGGECG